MKKVNFNFTKEQKTSIAFWSSIIVIILAIAYYNTSNSSIQLAKDGIYTEGVFVEFEPLFSPNKLNTVMFTANGENYYIFTRIKRINGTKVKVQYSKSNPYINKIITK